MKKYVTLVLLVALLIIESACGLSKKEFAGTPLELWNLCFVKNENGFSKNKNINVGKVEIIGSVYEKNITDDYVKQTVMLFQPFVYDHGSKFGLKRVVVIMKKDEDIHKFKVGEKIRVVGEFSEGKIHSYGKINIHDVIVRDSKLEYFQTDSSKYVNKKHSYEGIWVNVSNKKINKAYEYINITDKSLTTGVINGTTDMPLEIKEVEKSTNNVFRFKLYSPKREWKGDTYEEYSGELDIGIIDNKLILGRNTKVAYTFMGMDFDEVRKNLKRY